MVQGFWLCIDEGAHFGGPCKNENIIGSPCLQNSPYELYT